MYNNIRTRNELPFNFVDGLKVRGVDIESLIPGIEGIPEAGIKYQFAGDGVNRSFTLPVTPYNKDAIEVHVKQLYIHSTGYTLNNNVVVLNSPPPAITQNETYNVEIKVNLTYLGGYVDASRVAFEGTNLDTVLQSTKTLSDYQMLRLYGGTSARVTITNQGITGVFYKDVTDVESKDNDGTVIVSLNGDRWKRNSDGITNVRWFGAKGAGPINDTTSIQKAINATPPGGTLFMPDGFYRHTGLVIDKSIFLVGASMAGTILFNTSTFDALTINNNAKIWGLENMSILGNGTLANSGADATSGNGIVLDSASSGYIKRVQTRFNGKNGLYFKGNNQSIVVTESRFEYNKEDGVRGAGYADRVIRGIYLDDNHIENNNMSGINLWGEGISVSKGICSNNKKHGIEFNTDNQTNSSVCRTIKITDLTMEDNQKGSLYFKGRYLSGTTFDGLDIDNVIIEHRNHLPGRQSWADKAVVFARGDSVNTPSEIVFKGVKWGSNQVAQYREGSEAAVDFGNVLSGDSSIMLLHPTDQDSYKRRYINAGGTSKIGLRRKTISGYMHSKGAIVYPWHASNSENIKKSSFTLFPIDYKDGTMVYQYGIEVYTSRTDYSVVLDLIVANSDGTETIVSRGIATSQTMGRVDHIANAALAGDKIYVLKVTVNLQSELLVTPLYISNPYIVSN